MFNLPHRSRRGAPRHLARVRVYAVTGDGVQACSSRNISRGGIFLESDYLGFVPGESIELVFPFEHGQVVRLRRHRAIVVHHGFTGAGLTFLHPIEAA
jgi:hypothetical protein